MLLKTCSEIDDQVEQKEGVWDSVEQNPRGTEAVVKESYCNW